MYSVHFRLALLRFSRELGRSASLFRTAWQNVQPSAEPLATKIHKAKDAPMIRPAANIKTSTIGLTLDFASLKDKINVAVGKEDFKCLIV